MSELIHVYCDESCHLEHDRASSMALGAIWCPASHRAQLGRQIKALRAVHELAPEFEIKWVKISPAKLDFYLALVDLFFDEPLLHFRGLVVPDKSALDHQRFAQTHDEFYYKMWYQLLKWLISPEQRLRVFIDIKDTRGQEKVTKLHDILCNANCDFDRNLIGSVEQVHSHHVPLLQLADLLIGALSYLHRGLAGSPAKQAVIERIQQRSGLSLERSSLVREEKFNLFIWRPQA